MFSHSFDPNESLNVSLKPKESVIAKRRAAANAAQQTQEPDQDTTSPAPKKR